jgi:hypothetical protein
MLIDAGIEGARNSSNKQSCPATAEDAATAWTVFQRFLQGHQAVSL